MNEWEFDTSPEEVDLNRLWSEWGQLPGIYAFSYLGQLKINAPKTYSRLRQWRLDAGCTIVNWH